MYSFNPIPDVPVDHKGFIAILAICACWMLIAVWEDPESFFVWFFILSIPTMIAYGVSYHWTDQSTKVYPNVKVTAQFVKYESEGYRERSGKSYVDRHYTYVVYSVPEGEVMLPCVTGTPYPKTAILYKN